MSITAIVLASEPYEQPIDICCVDLTHLPSVIHAGLTTAQMQELMDNAKHLFTQADVTLENLQRVIVQFYLDGLPMRKQGWSASTEFAQSSQPVQYGQKKLWCNHNEAHTLPRVAICLSRPAMHC